MMNYQAILNNLHGCTIINPYTLKRGIIFQIRQEPARDYITIIFKCLDIENSYWEHSYTSHYLAQFKSPEQLINLFLSSNAIMDTKLWKLVNG